MKRFRWQLIIIFLTGIIVGVLLLGEQSVETNVVEPEPIRGGIYSEALIGSLLRLNPILDAYNSVDRDVDRLIFSGLLRIDDRGLPQPDLAESWGISQDGTIFNLTLRQDLTWHDGAPVTTEDVLFTIELLREGSEIIPEDLYNFWQEIEVIALSEDTLQFRLPEAFSPFPDYLTFGILPAHLLANLTFDEIIDDPFNLNPVGSGPYQFDRLIVETDQITGIVLSVFDDYYGEKPFIEQIVFRYYPDGFAALQAYRDGIVQGIGMISDDILENVLQEPALNLYTGRMPEQTLIFLNLNNPEVAFFQEPSIRKALLQGINRQWIIDKLLNGQGIIANGVILPNTWAHYDGLEPIPYDLDAAKLAIKEAGYLVSSETGTVREKDGLIFQFELLYPDDDVHQALAESIQNDWKQLDIEIDLVPLPYDEIVNGRLQARSFEAALVNLDLSKTPDPDPYPFWDQAQATGGQNYSQWDNRVASEYLEQARVTTDLLERERLYRNFQVVFYNEMPSLPIYFTIYNYAVDQSVQGVRVGPIFDSSDRFATISDWFLISRKPESPGEPESE